MKINNILSQINVPAVFVLLIYPTLLIGLAILYIHQFGFGWFEGILFVLGYYICNISVGIGLHRLWAHDTYKANKILEFILILLSAGTLQGPALAWASDHYNHHTYTDTGRDPHSPQKYKNKFLGFIWSHIGWMLVGEPSYKNLNRFAVTKLGRNKLLVWQMKHYWALAVLMNTLVPALIGFMIGGNLISAYGAFLFIGLGRALQQQATFCVNSVCHFLGSRNYYLGTAGDIWWMAVFLLGENWHNFHHAFPSDYRNGSKWYHADVHKWIIYGLSKIGLAYDLKVTEETRIQAKLLATQKQLQDNSWQQLVSLKEQAQALLLRIKQNISELENTSVTVKNNVVASFNDTQESLKLLIEQISTVDMNNPAKRIMKIFKVNSIRLHKLEKNIVALYSRLGFSY